MRRMPLKSVFLVLAEKQNRLHIKIAQDILDSENHDSDFIKTVTTGEEAWIYG